MTQAQAEQLPQVNSNWRWNRRNRWGQTEEEFWSMVEDITPDQNHVPE